MTFVLVYGLLPLMKVPPPLIPSFSEGIVFPSRTALDSMVEFHKYLGYMMFAQLYLALFGFLFHFGTLCKASMGFWTGFWARVHHI